VALAGVYNARIRIQNGEISEIESFRGTGRNSWPQGEIAGKPLPRETMIQLTERHLWGLWTGVGTPSIYTDDIIRTENGSWPLYLGQETCKGPRCARDMNFYGMLIKNVAER